MNITKIKYNMGQYISKSAIVAEIKKHQAIWDGMDGDYCKGQRLAYSDVLSFIDTLEVKEVEKFIWNNARTTIPEDSTNQIICIKEDGLAVSTIGKIVNGTVKWAYLDDLLNTNSFNVEVKVREDLGEYINELSKQFPEVSFAKLSRIAVRVAKWQKEHLAKEVDLEQMEETP